MAGVSDINWLYNKYYGDNPPLREIVTVHSNMVAKKALEIAHRLNLNLDKKDIYIAAMLHDIGVVKCNAPDIFAHGDLPYLQHGLEGKKILEDNGLNNYANICSTHTGSGITAEEIIKNRLPLPPADYLPTTLLEKLICYADKFYSKSKDLTKEKDITRVIAQMQKFGSGPLQRFLELHSLFSPQD